MSYSTIARCGTTLLILVVLFGPSFAQMGMFFDGITYAGIARQLSLGMGALWSPYYSPYLYPEFFCHLPVWLGWQSFFFLVLGDAWWVDNVFQMVNLVLTLVAMYWLWIEIWRLQPLKIRPNFHVIIWLWLTVPIVLWTYKNNLLEVGVSYFALMAVSASFKAMSGQSKWSLLAWSVVAAFMTLGALGAKGVVGLFPLAIGLVWLIFYKERRGRAWMFSFLILFFFLLFLGTLFWFVPEALYNARQHLNTQLFPALRGEMEITTVWRGKILFDGLLEILPVILLTACVSWRRSFIWTSSQKQIFWSLVVIGLLASLPLCLSLKQRKFYLIPSIPYFVMAASVFWCNIKPFEHISRNTFVKLKWAWFAGLVGSMMFLGSMYGGVSRDEAKWEVAMRASKAFTPGTVFLVSPYLANDYTLIACFVRVGSMYISDNPSSLMTHEIREVQVDDSIQYVIAPLSPSENR